MPINPRGASLVAVLLLAACSEEQGEKPEELPEFHQRALVVTDFGEEGVMAYFPPKKDKIFEVVFDGGCASCLKAAEAIMPSSVYDTKLCDFHIIASGTVRPSPTKLSAVLVVHNVSSQPKLLSCMDLDKPAL